MPPRSSPSPPPPRAAPRNAPPITPLAVLLVVGDVSGETWRCRKVTPPQRGHACPEMFDDGRPWYVEPQFTHSKRSLTQSGPPAAVGAVLQAPRTTSRSSAAPDLNKPANAVGRPWGGYRPTFSSSTASAMGSTPALTSAWAQRLRSLPDDRAPFLTAGMLRTTWR